MDAGGGAAASSARRLTARLAILSFALLAAITYGFIAMELTGADFRPLPGLERRSRLQQLVVTDMARPIHKTLRILRR